MVGHFCHAPARPDRRALAWAGPVRAGKHGEMPWEMAESYVLAGRGKSRIWLARCDAGGALLAFGLDLWFKPLAAIRGWSRVRPLRTYLLHAAQCLPQVGEPGVLVLTDQAHAPGESVAATAGRPGIDEGVQHPPLRLA